MSKYKDKSNNEIILERKALEQEHQAIKDDMLNDWDKLLVVERNYAEASAELSKRLKGE